MIYSIITKHLDEHDREWRSYFKIRANGVNHAFTKAQSIFDDCGLNLRCTNVRECPHQKGVHFIGKSGRLMSVGKEIGTDSFSLGHVRHVVDGEVRTIGELDLNEHEYVVTRAFDMIQDM